MPARDHFTQQLEAPHPELRSLGQLVVAAISWSLGAFNHHDTSIVQRVVTEDHEIDQAQYTLEEHAIGVIATQQPVAGDLRRLIVTIAIASELERIGDHTKSIAKIVLRDSERPPLESPAGIAQVADRALSMLDQVLEAFILQDIDAAQALGTADDQVDTPQQPVRVGLLDRLQREPTNASQVADLLAVTHNLERIADRTTNIAERVVFTVSGAQVELNR